jgi:hypothetical protein
LGANIDSYGIGGNYGFNTTVNWKATDTGVRNLTKSITTYFNAYRTSGVAMASSALQDLVDEGDN